ncbi:MAG: uncharacterized protein KVP18_000015 [Porospora cf. gigantea A]|uniref:uncharacterized protein n=1 Tax=Porospora cf. gigantea A TaxID=2853593 RepID=UPI00355A84B8|nr:MAG: hypothetical protein KVP18_000015 [Porospora cf. gigantea A]
MLCVYLASCWSRLAERTCLGGAALVLLQACSLFGFLAVCPASRALGRAKALKILVIVATYTIIAMTYTFDSSPVVLFCKACLQPKIACLLLGWSGLVAGGVLMGIVLSPRMGINCVRKLLHLVAAIGMTPVGVEHLEVAMLGLAVLSFLAVFWECIRQESGPFAERAQQVIECFADKRDRGMVVVTSHFGLLASFLLPWAFKLGKNPISNVGNWVETTQTVAFTCLADSAASIMGKLSIEFFPHSLGKSWANGKTSGGSLAFVITGFLASLPTHSPLVSMAMSVTTAAFEATTSEIDNCLLPLVASAVETIVIKNLPHYADDKLVRQFVGAVARPEDITDVTVPRTAKGKSRQFCFVGLKTAVVAEDCIKALRKTFFDTRRVFVEAAREQGDSDLARPWSSHTMGSSRHKALHPELYQTEVEKHAFPEVQKLKDIFAKPAARVKHKAWSNEDDLLIPEHTKNRMQEVEYADSEDSGDDLLQSVPSGKTSVESVENNDESQDVATSYDPKRVLVRNLPFSCSGEDVQTWAAQSGEVVEVKLLFNRLTRAPQGAAFVVFAFESHAAAFVSVADLSTFQGRRVHVHFAEPERKHEVFVEQVGSSFKKAKQVKEHVLAQKESTWNLLYVSANAAVDAMATELGVEKEEILDLQSGDSLAARVALAEASVIKRVKKWLLEHNIDHDAFMSRGRKVESAALCALDRADDTLIVKHLPSDTDASALRSMFVALGPLLKFAVAPTKTVALVQYADSANAAKALKRCAFRKLPGTNAPLFLEMAPANIFTQRTEPEVPETADARANTPETHAPTEESESEETPDAQAVFVKNVNFATTEASVRTLFRKAHGFLHFKLSTRKKDGARVSLGFGFATFENAAAAESCIKRFQGQCLDGKTLELSLSHHSGGKKQPGPRQDVESRRVLKSAVDKKLVVKNLPFEATKKDLYRLYGSVAQLAGVRIPKKPDGTSRGFAFLDFQSKTDAWRAIEDLEDVHLLGRRLVLQAPTHDDLTNVEEALVRTKKRLHSGAATGQLKKFKNVLEAEST